MFVVGEAAVGVRIGMVAVHTRRLEGRKQNKCSHSTYRCFFLTMKKTWCRLRRGLKSRRRRTLFTIRTDLTCGLLKSARGAGEKSAKSSARLGAAGVGASVSAGNWTGCLFSYCWYCGAKAFEGLCTGVKEYS